MSSPAISTRPARSFKAAATALSERDPVLRRLVAKSGPPQVNPPTETHFEALVRAILYQQLAGAAARAIHGRLIAALGGEVTTASWPAARQGTVGNRPLRTDAGAARSPPGLDSEAD